MKSILSLIAICFSLNCLANPERPYLELLDRDLSFEDLSLESDNWSKIGNKIQNFGSNRSPLWVRSTLSNSSNSRKKYYIEIGAAYLDEIDFYSVNQGKIFHEKNGVINDSSMNEVFHRHSIFSVELYPGETASYYIKFFNSGLLVVPIRLWEENEFIRKTQSEYIIHGLYFGAMISILFYNLIIFLIIKEKSFLYYCIYIFTVLFSYLILGGFLKQFFPSNDSYLLKPGLFISSYVAIASVLLFTSEFLEVKKTNKILDYILRTFAVGAILTAILSPIIPFNLLVQSFNFVIPLGSILMIVSAVFSYFRGIQQSGFFLLAWIIVTFGVILESLTNLNYISMEYWIARYATQISSLIEVILFSFAIGSRIKSLTIEKGLVHSKLMLIEKDLEVARQIQNRILPESLPQIPNVKFHVKYMPLHAVGGDFYDYHLIDNNHFGILVADVTGHGVSAAMDSSTVKIAFNHEPNLISEPRLLLKNMSKFIENTLDHRFVTAVYAFFNLDKMEMNYSTAGHPPLLLIRNSKIKFLDGEGFYLGLNSESDYSQNTINLEAGDLFLFYTDGLDSDINTDLTSEEIIENLLSDLNLEDIKADKFLDQFLNLAQTKRQTTTDDITLFSVKIS